MTFPGAADNNHPFIAHFNNIKTVASTVPANGDVNPYGVAIVPVSTGNLDSGSVLVSNFNNSQNNQGLGTTIVEIDNNHKVKLFASLSEGVLPSPCPGGIGLTTALVALRSGFVVVGSLPTTNGMSPTAMAGCLIVVNSHGTPVAVIAGGGINGPWDMTAVDFGTSAALFVTNVLNGTVMNSPMIVNQGTVLRIMLSTPANGTPSVMGPITQIGSHFEERTDVNALVIGPTGLGIGGNGTLYVADTLQNRIAAIPNALTTTGDAMTGTTVSQNGTLNGPLGLAIAPDGDILTVNGGDGNMVEITPGGQQVATRNVDVSGQGGGTLFGLAIEPNQHGVYLVNDGNNTLGLLH